MTMTRFLGAGAVAAVLVCMLGLTAPAQESAPTQKQLDIAALRAQRKAVVGQNMKLTAKQAQVFWPLYEKYEDAMDKVDNRHAREIKEYAKNYQNLTDEQANRKLDEVMQVAQDRIDVQRRFIPKFRAVLPGITVTRFFQVDNKLHALVQCQIAQLVPLASKPDDNQ
jgi:Spy/CpxP family protein refolding chaperone